MAYLTVAYPKISDKDFEWIQEYRSKNDYRYFSLIKPHFTFVFAASDFAIKDFISEVKKQAENISKIDFELNVAVINKDDSGEYYHEFLVPEKGFSAIIKLHDKLYSGVFASDLRFDIDYIPHVGVGNSNDVQESKKRIELLNNEGFSIFGVIDTLDIIEYKNNKIVQIDKVALR